MPRQDDQDLVVRVVPAADPLDLADRVNQDPAARDLVASVPAVNARVDNVPVGSDQAIHPDVAVVLLHHLQKQAGRSSFDPKKAKPVQRFDVKSKSAIFR